MQLQLPAGPRSHRGPSEGFAWPELVPWSLLGPDFIDNWGRNAEGEFEGEHMEVTGQSGSGKSYAVATLLHQRALSRDTATVFAATKLDDSTVARLVGRGWPRVAKVDDARRARQCIYWPEPKAVGHQRDQDMESALWDLLTSLWRKDANTVLAFDEIGYVQDLRGPKGHPGRMKAIIRQFWREARALGISVLASKQRPVGVVRDQHSESRWKIVFPPADTGDMTRFAELLGRPADWAPVLESLDQELHQFVIRNSVTKTSYISWIDFKLESLPQLPKREDHSLYQGDRQRDRV